MAATLVKLGWFFCTLALSGCWGATTGTTGSPSPFVRAEVASFVHLGDTVKVSTYYASAVTVTVRNLLTGTSNATTHSVPANVGSVTVPVAAPLFPDLATGSGAIDYFAVECAASGTSTQPINFAVVHNQQAVLPPDLTNLRKVYNPFDLALAIRDAWSHSLTLLVVKGDSHSASSSYSLTGAFPDVVVLREWSVLGTGPAVYRPSRMDFTVVRAADASFYLSELWIRR